MSGRREVRELINCEGVELCCHRSGHFSKRYIRGGSTFQTFALPTTKKAECILTTHSALEEQRRSYAPATAGFGSSGFAAYFRLNFSMRPAESSSFCLPVKNGWQFAQISIWRLPVVERVSNTLPHTQVTTAFLYVG